MTSLFFQDKSLSCAIVAPSQQLRMQIVASLRTLGFTQIVNLSDLRSLCKMLEAEPIDWVLANFNDPTANVLQLLHVIKGDPRLHQTKVSILGDMNEPLLPFAFELGALSCHNIALSTEQCVIEFDNLAKRCATYDGNLALVAASYLKTYFNDLDLYQEVIGLCLTLQRVFPDQPAVSLDLAVARMKGGEEPHGLAGLYQLQAIYPDVSVLIQHTLTYFYEGRTDRPTIPQVFGQLFGLKGCLVIEPRESVRLLAQELMKSLGFGEVHSVKTALEGWQWITKGNKPSLIFFHWGKFTSDDSSPYLLYKISKYLEDSVPIVVNANKDDKQAAQHLCEDLGVGSLISEDYGKDALISAVVWVLSQTRQPSDCRFLIKSIKLAARVKDVALIASLKGKILRHPAKKEGDGPLIEAFIAQGNRAWDMAKVASLQALKLGSGPIETQGVLCAALVGVGEYREAARLLDNLRQLSPYNTENILLQAECKLELNDLTGFEALLRGYKDILGESPLLQELQIKSALKLGLVAKARELLGNLFCWDNIISYLNRRAMDLIKKEKYDEGLVIYQQALACFSEQKKAPLAALYYNMALGYARAGRWNDAVERLACVEKCPASELTIKAFRLKRQIETATDKQNVISLKQGTNPPFDATGCNFFDDAQSQSSPSNSITLAKRPDYQLLGVYKYAFKDDKTKQIDLSPLNFNLRRQKS